MVTFPGLSVALMCSVFSPAKEVPRPNILLIMADDLGYSDLGCYGSEIPTPNLDYLASQGVLFRQFYNQAKCSPSRASILSGLYYQQGGTGLGDEQLTLNNFVTLPQVLGAAGYMTGNFGKWHVSGDAGTHGFERFVERPNGEDHFLTSVDINRTNTPLAEMTYGPDLYTDYAIDFIDESLVADKPFFAFMAYYAPHFPLQAPEELITPHESVYTNGWDALRTSRYQRQLELGVIPSGWGLSDRDPVVPDWDSLSEGVRGDETRLMAVYSAMVQRLDWNIGRLVNHLEEKGLKDNTLILFLSDNGACPWVFNGTPTLAAGPPNSSRSYDSKWANACNTPFRYHKQFAHEGGIHTPAIAFWPNGIKNPGRMVDRVCHVLDVMPTLTELSGGIYPKTYDGHEVLPMEGESFTSVFGADIQARQIPLYWELFGFRGVRNGQWKLSGERGYEMEMFDLSTDGTEGINLRQDQPDQFAQLASDYEAWAARVGAKTDAYSISIGPSTQDRLFFFNAASGVTFPVNQWVSIRNHNFTSTNSYLCVTNVGTRIGLAFDSSSPQAQWRIVETTDGSGKYYIQNRWAVEQGLSQTNLWLDTDVLSGVSWHRTGKGSGEDQLVRNNFITLPQVLGPAGYVTGNFGKWHVSGNAGIHGFDQFVERPASEDHFLTSLDVNGTNVALPVMRYGPDVYTDYAIRFMDDALAAHKPFFTFLAFHAPHYPLQAPEELITPHESVYASGWDELRRARYERQVSMGLIPPDWPLSARDEVVPEWDSLTQDQKKKEARLMAVYAAMVERMDWNVGRLREHLRENGSAENTLVLFLSDNGACPWVKNKTPETEAGSPDSFRSYDSKWANLCNTPFRYHKQWAHEGGIHTPAIAYWPNGIQSPGRMVDRVCHVVDVMPTLIDLCGGIYPQEFGGHKVLPQDGESFASVFGLEQTPRSKPICWEFFGGRAIRDGNWKLVGERGKPMELYDIAVDGTELNDLKDQYPERYQAMRTAYDAWAAGSGAKSDSHSVEMGLSKQKRQYP